MFYGVNMVLQEKDKEQLKKILEPLEKEVKILFFRKNEPSCMYCDVIEELLADIASVNDKVKYEVIDIDKDPERAKKYNVERGPTILFEEYPNIIYMGIPSGHEFRAFIDDILLVGTGKLEFELNPHLEEHIKAIDEPIDIYVFVTPTCPYCPFAVKAAHRLAYINPNVRGYMIEAIEYGDLADKYNVSAVPKNVVLDGETKEVLLEWEGCPPVIDQAVEMFAHYVHHALLHKKGVPHDHEH